MEEELKIQYPSLQSLLIGDLITRQKDTICHAVLAFSGKIYNADKRKIEAWLKARSDADTLEVIFK
jgi:hypothetical protein